MKKRRQIRHFGALSPLFFARCYGCRASSQPFPQFVRVLADGIGVPMLLQARQVGQAKQALYAVEYVGPSTRATSSSVRACRQLSLRGGESSSSTTSPFELTPTTRSSAAAASAFTELPGAESDESGRPSAGKSTSVQRRRHRSCSDVVEDLVDADRGLQAHQQHGISEEILRESTDLRRLIVERRRDHLEEIREALEPSEWEGDSSIDDDGPAVKLPDPRRLLSYLAPKVPAIRNSPDASLRVQCNAGSPDPGLASAVLAGVAHACLVRDRAEAQLLARRHRDDPGDEDEAGAGSRHLATSGDEARLVRRRNRRRHHQNHHTHNLSILISRERRFEQLVECVLCGVDVSGWMNEYTRQRIDHSSESIEDWFNLDSEPGSDSAVPSSHAADGGKDSSNPASKERQVSGLAIRDAVRAAWGLSLLIGSHHNEQTIGGEKISDIFIALSLHIRERLLSQMQELREGDLSAIGRDVDGLVALLAEHLAEDAALALWAFGCVTACTGLRFAPLFEIGCVILCQNPFELRKHAQDVAQGEFPLYGNVGASDIVDRLAEAEEESNAGRSILGGHPSSPHMSHHARKDVLLDYLSPSQTTDVLWALALHGSRSHEGSSLDEIALSEPAAALRDVICDRMIAWLHEELDHIKSADEDASELDEMKSVPQSFYHDSSETNEAPSKVESMTIGGLQSVAVVDAAAVLASETSQPDTCSEDAYEHIGSPSHLSRDTSHGLTRSSKVKLLLKFSPGDLCSIAWAVTELHDSLQPAVTNVVMSIFMELGAGSLNDLEGRDLSNLAWAIAKSTTPSALHGADSSLMLISWVCDAMVPIEGTGTFLSLSRLSKLQPPELGRLMWAVSTVYSFVDVPFSERPASSCHLALASMHVAKAGFSEYGAEDLARIAWGFMELGDMETLLDFPELASSLGTMLSIVKSALLDWESGTLQPKYDENEGSRNPFSFLSFFGRARFLAHLMDQRIDQPSAEEGDEFSPSILTKRTLPLLKDLPLDPSTLCKITSSFGMLHVGGGEVFARVALRLMTSRSGRLLQECPMNDIVRLCETLASGGVPLGRERVSLFVRKLVYLFNTEWAAGDTYALTSGDAAVLIWSLGELGVKCVADPGSEDVSSAHRRLQLLGRLPVDKIDTRSLSTENAMKLLTGLLSSHFALTRPDKAGEVLTALVNHVPDLTAKQICSLAEVVAKLKYLVSESSPDQHRSSSAEVKISNSPDENDIEYEDRSGPVTILTPECDRMLSLLARTATRMVSEMTCEDLRRLISVYALSPFRADELVAAASREVEARLERMEFLSGNGANLEPRIKSIASRASASLGRLHVGEAPGFGATIRKGLTSFFGANEKVDADPLGGETSEEALIEDLRDVLASIVDLSEEVSSLSRVAGASVGDSCRAMSRSAAFELGRCRDLVDHYNRLDFETGARRSRHLNEDKRTMAKQVLSRLLP